MTLYVVASFDNWSDIMFNAIDATKLNEVIVFQV